MTDVLVLPLCVAVPGSLFILAFVIGMFERHPVAMFRDENASRFGRDAGHSTRLDTGRQPRAARHDPTAPAGRPIGA